MDALGLGLGSLPIAPIGAVSYHLIVPDPSALTCQDLKEQTNHNRFVDANIGGRLTSLYTSQEKKCGEQPKKTLNSLNYSDLDHQKKMWGK